MSPPPRSHAGEGQTACVMKKRTYSKEEIAALLERAAELHAQEAQSTNEKPGLTLSEIEEVAAESGIDPLLVRQAATEMSGAPRLSSLKTSETTDTHNVVERVIPGTLKPEAWEDIVLDLRHRYDSSWEKMMGVEESKTEQIGRSVQWRHMNASGLETKVLIRPRGNKLHLVLRQRVGWAGSIASSISYGAIIALIAAMFTGGGTESVLIAAIVTIATLAVTIPLIYWLDKSWRKKKHREIESLADSISNTLILSQTDSHLESEAIPLEDYASGRIDESLLESDEDTLDQSEPSLKKNRVT